MALLLIAFLVFDYGDCTFISPFDVEVPLEPDDFKLQINDVLLYDSAFVVELDELFLKFIGLKYRGLYLL